MFVLPNWWFDFIVVLSAIILYKDYNGTLEEDLNKFELSIGIRTELPPEGEETGDPVPYYIPPTSEVDSTWILPDSLRRN